jgi:hypothetical protein
MPQSPLSPRLAPVAPMLVFALVLVLQLPLLGNPGYFSHDELQWASFAAQGRHVAWGALDAFQYRPLTFNLWLALSRALFAQPPLFHALCVAWGAANAGLLCALARRFEMAMGPAVIGAGVFALGPFAIYVQGWVGTLADLIWVSCALLGGLCVRRWPRVAASAATGVVFTMFALLAKEAAVVLPGLAALAWWLDARYRLAWRAATLASAAVVALYLALRLPLLLHAPAADATYAVSLANVPLRWLEYQLYPLLIQKFETFTTLARGFDHRIAVAALLWLALLVVLWRSGSRLLVLFLAGGVVALAPVLLLGASWPHYAYAFAALATMTVAAAWPRAGRGGRLLIAMVALLWLWHGANVMRTMREVGEIQARFSPALADVLRARTGGVRLALAPGARAWVFQRLTHDIPSYDGVPIGGRVVLVDAGAVDFVVEPDGSLQRVR